MQFSIKNDKKFNLSGLVIHKYAIEIVFLYFLIRILLILFTYFIDAMPFICYDDLYIYDKITTLTSNRIDNLFAFRNNYYLISMLLNNIRIGEYLTGGRLLNFFLFLLSVFKFKKIADLLNIEKKASKNLMILFCASPYFVIYSMIQLREIICVWCVAELIYSFLRYEKEKKINVVYSIIIIILLYFTRVYVLEVLISVILFYKLRNSKWYVKLILLAVVSFVVALMFKDSTYMYVLNDKIEHYINDGVSSSGLLAKFEITGFDNIYNLIFLVPYIQIAPLPGAYDVYYNFNSWGAWITLCSGVASFYLPYFWINVIRNYKKKDNNFNKIIITFYLIFITIIAITEPSNSRFVFFTTPIYYLYGVEGFVVEKQKNRYNILMGCFFACIPYIYLLF